METITVEASTATARKPPRYSHPLLSATVTQASTRAARAAAPAPLRARPAQARAFPPRGATRARAEPSSRAKLRASVP